ncbi:MAG TPA: VWA domain-containing protein [candidate division Zixibacteria bacterium]|nr:VWA domain-containing protein [candidate division Zixibacteria bacterium]
MVHFRYSRWNGSGREGLDAETVFDQLNDYMNDSGDLQQAMRRLMQKGLKRGEKQTKGLDDLLSQIAREMRKLYDQYRLQSAMDELEERLESVVEEERRALDEMDQAGRETRAKREFLEDLPRKVSEAVEKLAAYEFESSRAEEEFRKLLQDLDKIRKLENWLRREGSLFRGQTPADFQKSMEIMERMEELRRLEGQLSSMQLKDVDRELLEKLLGGDPKQDFEGIMRMQSLLEEGGYVVEQGERFELTPRAVRRVGQLALRDIYRQLRRDGIGRHSLNRRGSHEQITEETRPYVQGDPLRIAMIQTLKNALIRGGGVPVRIDPGDFSVYESEHTTRAATVLLLDMSWSMSWEGRFAAAKKVALAMEALVRTLYPRDYFGIVGFFTRAVELKAKDLPQATWNMGDPFTNLQDGLHLAAELLERRPSPNQQMIVITDGQPTAYCRQGRLYCEWPLSFGGISQRAAEETLKEAERITRKGITINTFMLDDSPVLRGFVDDLTRINKGRAFYTRPDRLGEYLLVDYMSHQRKRV